MAPGAWRRVPGAIGGFGIRGAPDAPSALGAAAAEPGAPRCRELRVADCELVAACPRLAAASGALRFVRSSPARRSFARRSTLPGSACATGHVSRIACHMLIVAYLLVLYCLLVVVCRLLPVTDLESYAVALH
jgi:hypothetical protein